MVSRADNAFSVDVVSDTGVMYLEGIYAPPEARGRGFGSMTLALCRRLLRRAGPSAVSQRDKEPDKPSTASRIPAASFYDTIFLNRTKTPARGQEPSVGSLTFKN